MTSDELIAKLAERPTPVTPVAPRLIAGFWLLTSLAGVVAFSVGTGVLRSDWRAAAWELGAAALLALLAAHRAVLVALPGRHAGLALTGLAVAALFLALASHGGGAPVWHGWQCTATLLLFALVPGVVLGRTLLRLAPTDPARAARATGLAASALGVLGVGLCCTSENVAHLVLYHGLPVLLVMAAAGYGARRFLRW